MHRASSTDTEGRGIVCWTLLKCKLHRTLTEISTSTLVGSLQKLRIALEYGIRTLKSFLRALPKDKP